MIKLKSLITEKFPDYRDIAFFNKEFKWGFTPQDLQNIKQFSGAFGKKLKMLIVKKNLVKALPTIFFRDAVEKDEDGIRTTAEKLINHEEFIQMAKDGQLG